MTDGQHSTQTVDSKVAFLTQAEGYPDRTSAVNVIETHMSWVFITDKYVYKLKKPVRQPFLDFSTLPARKHYCEESMRLNRRLAPDVYLDVVALTRDESGKLQVEGDGEPVEWLEKLQRLPQDKMLDVAIGEGRVTVRDVRQVAEVLSKFYASAEPVELSPAAYRQRFSEDIKANHRALLDATYGLDHDKLQRISAIQLRLLRDEPELLDARVKAGKVIEAHGDLRPEHVCLLPEPVVIDSLEFNRDFRLMDIADELSYLALECEFAGGAFIGPVIFSTYEQQTGDRIPQRLQHFYKSCRAVLRAKLAAWHTQDHPRSQHRRWLSLANAYLDLAEHYAEFVARPPADQTSSNSTIDPPS